MNAKLSKINYYNNFISFSYNREFYLLDSYENLKNFNITNCEDPDYIFIISENKEKQIEKNAYKRKDFLSDYEFIKVTQNESIIDINFLISKKKFIIGDRGLRLLTEIKSRQSLINEIYKNTKINLNTHDIISFHESTLVSNESNFYNRKFTLYIKKINLNNILNNKNKIDEIINSFNINDFRNTIRDIRENMDNIARLNYEMYLLNQQRISQNKPYIFSKKGLKNFGSTNYMNAALQFLFHINELIIYFIEGYPKEHQHLMEINKDNVISKGDISRQIYNLVINVNENSGNINNNNCQSDDSDNNSYNKDFSPINFQSILGKYNPQFKNLEANDAKDLILYLLQTMHEELNHKGNQNKQLNFIPDQYNLYETYKNFITNYNTNNLSIISLLFYGTYKTTTTCSFCKKESYNFQKFECISFEMINYNVKKFNILDGFRDNSNPILLKDGNRLFCNYCNKSQEAEISCKIFEPPNNLLINIDYGKNKIYQPSSVEFDEEIDITKFVDFDFENRIRYKIISVCTYYGFSGDYGHYIVFCRNKKNNIWYEFNDSFCSQCSKKEIYGGSPYLLLYERIFDN